MLVWPEKGKAKKTNKQKISEIIKPVIYIKMSPLLLNLMDKPSSAGVSFCSAVPLELMHLMFLVVWNKMRRGRQTRTVSTENQT